jgi:hypothetical protein
VNVPATGPSSLRRPPIAGEKDQTAPAGRMCPADYRHAPSVFDRPPEFSAEVLYVVGGLYGNLAALDQIERLAGAERAPTTIVFNGDFHWFDAEPEWFAEIERRVARHRASRGNVETEIARWGDIGAGCGCAYRASVGEDLVQRSNEILAALRHAAAADPATARRLNTLPMHMVADVGGLRIAILHGDATALAGWSFAHDALDDPAAPALLTAVHRAARVDLFASTHTCLAALRDFALPPGRLTVINNGAAGMPNFTGSRFGLVSRIATAPSPHLPLYGLARDGIHIDAIPIAYDHDAFLRRFLARWPEGSAAHTSFFQRITSGPAYTVGQAKPPSAGPDRRSPKG